MESVIEAICHHDLCYHPVPLTKRQFSGLFKIVMMSNHLSGNGNHLFCPVQTPRQLRYADLHSGDTE